MNGYPSGLIGTNWARIELAMDMRDVVTPAPSRRNRSRLRKEQGPGSPAGALRRRGQLSGERRPIHLRLRVHVAVAQMRRRLAILEVLVPHHGEAVLVWADVGALRNVEVVELGVGAAEDHVLERAVGGSERLEAVLLLHVLRDFEAAQRLDLPLRRAGPHRVGAPYDFVVAKTLTHDAHQRGAKAGLRHDTLRKELADVGV